MHREVRRGNTKKLIQRNIQNLPRLVTFFFSYSSYHWEQCIPKMKYCALREGSRFNRYIFRGSAQRDYISGWNRKKKSSYSSILTTLFRNWSERDHTWVVPIYRWSGEKKRILVQDYQQTWIFTSDVLPFQSSNRVPKK